LPANCDDAAWLAGLERLLGDIDTFSPDALVVSLGVDGLIEDPNSTLALTPDAFVVAGEWLGSLQRPMLCVLEGGYVLDLLGSTLLGFLHAADRAR
jgi:acetoin utilization deacetylase AcuC-like enzyme